jgi:ABC-2 type transport system ATP-binding protein
MRPEQPQDATTAKILTGSYLSASGAVDEGTLNISQTFTTERFDATIQQLVNVGRAARCLGIGSMPDGIDSEIALITQDVRTNNIQRAVNRLSDLVDAQGQAFRKDIRFASINLMREYSRWNLMDITGTRPPEEISRLLSQIATRVLEVCEAFKGDQAPGISVNPIVRESTDGAAQRLGQETVLTDTLDSPSELPLSFDEGAVIEAHGIFRIHKSSRFRLEPLDIKVMPGKILAIVGVNGSGKSTLLDMLRGEIAPDGGLLFYPQLSPNPTDWSAIKSKIGFVAQRSRRWQGTVRENLEYACALHNLVGDANLEWTNRLIARHGLAPFENRKWAELSSGYRLRFDLVLARLHRPKLLILDEPLATLDPLSQQSFLFDLRQLAHRQGVAVIVTSQHLFEMEAVADEVLVLAGGKRIAVSEEDKHRFFEIWWPRTEFVSEERVRETFATHQPKLVKLGTTSCLIGFALRPELPDVVATAKQQGLTLSYIRNVTGSARVEMEQATSTLTG